MRNHSELDAPEMLTDRSWESLRPKPFLLKRYTNSDNEFVNPQMSKPQNRNG